MGKIVCDSCHGLGCWTCKGKGVWDAPVQETKPLTVLDEATSNAFSNWGGWTMAPVATTVSSGAGQVSWNKPAPQPPAGCQKPARAGCPGCPANPTIWEYKRQNTIDPSRSIWQCRYCGQEEGGVV